MKKNITVILFTIFSFSSIYGQYYPETYEPQQYTTYSDYDANNYLLIFKLLLIAVVYPIYSANDIYLHPNLSYLSIDNHNLKYKPTFSFDVGLRVDYSNSALEYGISHIVYESSVFDSNYNEIDYWGLHISYLQNIFSEKTPDKLNFYVGPSINYVSDFGIGGIVGVNYKLFDRLMFDFRYELTSQTNQLSAGLIFTYNKG